MQVKKCGAIFTLICLVNLTGSFAQSLRHTVALPYIGVNAYSTNQVDALSFTSNQAALANVLQTGVGVYAERRFLLAAASVYTMAVAIPTKMGNFGVVANYFGYNNFNENKLGLAYAKSLGSKVNVGIQFNYQGYRIPGYVNASAINFEAGAIFKFTEKLNGGIHVYNPVGGKLGKSGDEKLPAIYKAGFGFEASENFFAGAEIIKEEDRPVNVTAGFQYQFARQFFLRAGFMSATSAPFAGAGIVYKKLRLDVSGSYHPQLGFSPGLLFMANFGNKKENE